MIVCIGSNKINISKRVSELLLKTGIFKRTHIALFLQSNVLCLFLLDLHGERRLKPLGLVERSLRNDFLFKEHGSFDNDKLLTSFVFVGALGSPFPGIHISDGIFQVFLFDFDIRFSVRKLLGGSVKIVVTILSLGDDKTLAEGNFASIGLIPLISTAFGLQFISASGVVPIVSTTLDMYINLPIYCFVPLKQLRKQLLLVLFLVYLVINIVFKEILLVELHDDIKLVKSVGIFFLPFLPIFLLLIVFRSVPTQSPFGWLGSLFKIRSLFLRFFSATEVLIHIYLLGEFACSFLVVFESFLGAGTGLDIAFFFGVKLLEPDVLPLLNFLNILLNGVELLFIFVVTIVNHKLCKILGNEKLLLYLFIECETKAIVFFDCTTIVPKGTAARFLYRCL